MYYHLKFDNMEDYNFMILSCIRNQRYPRAPREITIYYTDFGPKRAERIRAARSHAFANFPHLLRFICK